MRLIPLEELSADIYKREGVKYLIKKNTGMTVGQLYSDFYPDRLPSNATSIDIRKRLKAMYRECGAYVTTHQINPDAIMTSFQVDFKDEKCVGMHLVMEHFDRDKLAEEMNRELAIYTQYVLVFEDGLTRHISRKPDISTLITKLRGLPNPPHSPIT
jgi:hypothetical protein